MHFVYEFQAEHLYKVLEAVAKEVASPQEMLGSIGESLLRVNDERHAQGLAPDGTPWAPLKPSTLEAKRGPAILNEHGDLLRFHSQVEGDSVAVGTNDWKAAIHHFGTKPYTILPKTKKALHFGGVTVKRVEHPGLPARELVGFPESDAQLVADVIGDHLTEVLSRL